MSNSEVHIRVGVSYHSDR